MKTSLSRNRLSRSHDIAKRRHDLERKGSWGGKGTGRAASWILGGHLHVELCHGGSGRGGGDHRRESGTQRKGADGSRSWMRSDRERRRKGRDGGPGQPGVVVLQRALGEGGRGRGCSFLSRWSVLAWPWPDGNSQSARGSERARARRIGGPHASPHYPLSTSITSIHHYWRQPRTY